jgi:hypothetical protein
VGERHNVDSTGVQPVNRQGTVGHDDGAGDGISRVNSFWQCGVESLRMNPQRPRGQGPWHWRWRPPDASLSAHRAPIFFRSTPIQLIQTKIFCTQVQNRQIANLQMNYRSTTFVKGGIGFEV